MQCHVDNTQAGDRPEAKQDEAPLLAQHLSSRTGLCSARSGLALALHVSLFVAYALRVSLSITIVAMTNSSHPHGWSGSAPHGSYPGFAQDAPVYNWSAETQGIVLSSFFYGYGLTQALGGYCSGLFGGKPILGSGLLLSSVLTLLVPPAAELGLSFLIGLQVLLGLAEGVIFPAQYTLWAKWAPPLERSRLMNIADAGQPEAEEGIQTPKGANVDTKVLVCTGASFAPPHFPIVNQAGGCRMHFWDFLCSLPGWDHLPESGVAFCLLYLWWRWLCLVLLLVPPRVRGPCTSPMD
ncbi:sodium-dependent phosphate transport protein 3-like [Chroicocephalus ridibundus]|uniref:sodium-dependent phosphate transport protein 3-like n=1 Tax=Chroicocephalus ridibundus TaxID=1192867 RepID=UPI002FDEAEA7